jgi:hypothetical protein
MSNFKNMTADEVKAAYKEVLGRDPNAKELEGFTTNNVWFRDGADLRRGIASTAEATRKGVDITKYGDAYVDSADGLQGKQLDVFNALREMNGKKYRIRKSEINSWADKGSVASLRASQGAKKITVKNGTLLAYDGKSLGYLKNENDEVDDANFSAGDTFFVPKGTKLKGRLKIVGDGKEFSEDYSAYDLVQKEARKKSGLVGSTMKTVGFSKGSANSFDKAAGQAASLGGPLDVGGVLFGDETSAILGGTRGAAARAKNFERLGVKADTLRKSDMAGDMASSVAAGAVDASIGMPVASTGVSLANQMEAESLGYADRDSWRRTLTGIAVDWAALGVTEGLDRAAKNARAAVVTGKGSAGLAQSIGAANVGWVHSKTFITTRAKGGTTKEAFLATLQSEIMSAVPAHSAKGFAARAGLAGAMRYAADGANGTYKGHPEEGFLRTLSVASSAANAYGKNEGMFDQRGSIAYAKYNLGTGGATASWENEALTPNAMRTAYNELSDERDAGAMTRLDQAPEHEPVITTNQVRSRAGVSDAWIKRTEDMTKTREALDRVLGK